MNKINLETSINHHIAISAIMIKRVFYKILSNHDLKITPEQWVLLNYISESNGYTIGELSGLSVKDFANTSRMIQKLDIAGFITKKADPADKRISKLYLSKEGKDLIEQLHQCAFESTNIAIEGIDKEIQEIVLHTLKKVISNTNNYLK